MEIIEKYLDDLKSAFDQMREICDEHLPDFGDDEYFAETLEYYNQASESFESDYKKLKGILAESNDDAKENPEEKLWIIAIANTEGDGTDLARFKGTEKQVIDKLAELMQKDQDDDLDFADEPELNEYGDIYGCNVFSDYHIDYTARPLDDIREA